jgi:hypothetical protein
VRPYRLTKYAHFSGIKEAFLSLIATIGRFGMPGQSCMLAVGEQCLKLLLGTSSVRYAAAVQTCNGYRFTFSQSHLLDR